jgi:hypothetical protein
MRKSIVSSFIIAALVSTVISTPVALCEEDEAKPAKEEATEELEQFDPQSYSCAKFLADLESPKGSGQEAGMALIWAHGFHSARYGTDEVGALNEEIIGEFAVNYGNYCKEHTKQTFSRAAYILTKEEE